MTARFVVLEIAALLACVMAPSGSNGDEAAQRERVPSIDAVIRVWTERQAAAERAHAAWIERRTDLKGSIPKVPGDSDPSPEPDKDTTYDGKCELVVSADRSFYSYAGMAWHGNRKRYEPYISTAVFDGSTAKHFVESATPEQYPRGIVRKKRQNIELETINFRPIMWFLRPLEPGMGGLRADQLQVNDEIADIDGARFFSVTEWEDKAHTHRRWLLWVDLGPDIAIRRALKEDGPYLTRMDVQYDGAGGKTKLIGWTIAGMRGGRIVRQFFGLDVALEVGIAVPDTTFQFEFPPTYPCCR